MGDWKDTDDILHIIAQPEQHGDAHILGTKEGLTRLRDAIDAAINTPNQTHKATEMTNDGEGFYALVQCVSADRVEALPLGYTDSHAKDESELPEWIA
ncbi:hypothetical protein HK15_13005 [Acetobacter orientalis]|uniref:Uncharacterized protein n=1 Tax=Acetobacter orientalis TaxID=146474 RepID=A0A252B334_9PROT|nr:hypothetical protein [Acetobacter orientalis]OUI98766.1 hypothetical protein HK15_13005 [Acetobacter orientalis]